MLSPETYRSVVLPIDKWYREQYTSFGLHHCGVFHPYAEAYVDLNVDGLDVGWGTDLRKTREFFPNTPISLELQDSALFGLSHDEIDALLRQTGMVTDESKSILAVPPPKIILAGSGMSHGGRIMHHEKAYLSDPQNTLLIIGYQVKGSLGRRLLEGANEVTIFGHTVSVRARIKSIRGYSAHADQDVLLKWVGHGKPKQIFLVHGEEGEAMTLAAAIRDEHNITTKVPNKGQKIEI